MMEKSFSQESLNDPKRGLTELEASDLNRTLKYYKGRKGNTESFHKGMPLKTIYEKLIDERDNYGWRVKTDTFDTLGYDVKFAYHLIRILSEGEELLRTGKLSYPISGKAREDIISVREGKVKLEQLLEMYEEYDEKCKEANENTVLPKKPNFNFANDYLIETLQNQIILEYFREKVKDE